MKSLGYLLIGAGFLGGALAAVWEEDRIAWNLLVPALAAGAAGVVIARRAAAATEGQEEALTASLQSIEESIRRIIRNIGDLNETRREIDVYDLRSELDGRFLEDLRIFVEGRESISRRHGLQPYADVMSHFAAGERYLNRVWCCSADGYIDEAHAYLDRAEEQFREVSRRFDVLARRGSAN